MTQVEVSLEEHGLLRKSSSVEVDLSLTAHDLESIRWYVEEYLDWPRDPAQSIATRVEDRLRDIGVGLFEALMFANDDTRDLWATLRGQLSEARVEVVTEPGVSLPLPWELIRDPESDLPIAIAAKAFVHAQQVPAAKNHLVATETSQVRILLAICRPRLGDDVPFRSVASHILRNLAEDAKGGFALEVLRPPTYEALAERLREAKAAGMPFHVLHFDGHGSFDGSRGSLVFENSAATANWRLVYGQELGELLAESDVPVLVLNACRSAYTGEPRAPLAPGTEVGGSTNRPEAWGSLAQEVMNSDVYGVVAMRYNIYVVSAAEFVSHLYTALAKGGSLGEAATSSRRRLADDPPMTRGSEVTLQDWFVPVVYEAAPVRLFSENDLVKPTSVGENAPMPDVAAESGLPPLPPSGFVGRHETILALDRLVHANGVVLLRGLAGCGKTTTAIEFAHWFRVTGGTSGPVLFTSFEHHLPLSRVLDQFAASFADTLESDGVNWRALEPVERLRIAVQILQKANVLWIWDNVESIAGFPLGVESAWTPEEQAELKQFLQAATRGPSRFVLTSRRPEQDWLGGLPVRISMPAMPPRERWELAGALAKERGKELPNGASLGRLLEFTQGNPLTVQVVVGQLLATGAASDEDVEELLDALTSDDASIAPAWAEGYDGALAIALERGLERGFSPEERKLLSLLHLFEGFVDGRALVVMAHPDADWRLAIQQPKPEQVEAVFNRACEIGLLSAYGGPYYGIHPAVPPFFKAVFIAHFGGSTLGTARAFVNTMAELGGMHVGCYHGGEREALLAIEKEEANLWRALRIAEERRWWPQMVDLAECLRPLFRDRGKIASWRTVVDRLVRSIVDPQSEHALPGREPRDWRTVTEYRTQLANQDRDWELARRLHALRVTELRSVTAPLNEVPAGELKKEERNLLQLLGVALSDCGQTQMEQGHPECIESLKESLAIDDLIGDDPNAAVSCYNLGRCYLEVSAVLDLDEAERWYRASLNKRTKGDRLGRARCLMQLGSVELARHEEANKRGDAAKARRQLIAAEQLYKDALSLFPQEQVPERATLHNQLGLVYDRVGDLGNTLKHFNLGIEYEEILGNKHGAAQTRFNVAISLSAVGRRADALDFANSALATFEGLGTASRADALSVRRWIEALP